MDYKSFNKIVEDEISKIKSTLINKQAEYMHSENRFDSFIKASKLTGLTVKQSLGGQLSKHIISIFDMINSNKIYPDNMWIEKITDAICYELLLLGIAKDENLELVSEYCKSEDKGE